MMTLATGTKLGRYEIRSQLGAGGMGEVYPQTVKDVAIELKEVRRELQSGAEIDTTASSGLRSEAQASGEAVSTQIGTAISSSSAVSLSTRPSSAEYLASQIKSRKKVLAIALALFVLTAGAAT